MKSYLVNTCRAFSEILAKTPFTKIHEPLIKVGRVMNENCIFMIYVVLFKIIYIHILLSLFNILYTTYVI